MKIPQAVISSQIKKKTNIVNICDLIRLWQMQTLKNWDCVLFRSWRVTETVSKQAQVTVSTAELLMDIELVFFRTRYRREKVRN